MNKQYVNYGCSLSAPIEWINFDVSPTLRIQRTPILGRILKKKLNIIFPDNVLYGDIIKGLPIEDNSCDGLYCSHTLEHLSLKDFRKAIINSYKVLKYGGIFRCVVPNLEYEVRSYLNELDNGNKMASIKFLNNTMLGVKERPRGMFGLITTFLGNSNHLWMWDHSSLVEELKNVGFSNIRICKLNDCEDPMFQFVEEIGRFENAVAIESRKELI